MEGYRVRELLKVFAMPAWFRDNIDFIEELQTIHDTETNWGDDDGNGSGIVRRRARPEDAGCLTLLLDRAAVVAETRSGSGLLITTPQTLRARCGLRDAFSPRLL